MNNKETNSKQDSILTLLNQSPVQWDTVLSEIIAAFDCTTGTIHFLDRETSMLRLVSDQGIPDFLRPKLSRIPIGKGMAGIAAERLEPVEMCNLQTDDSGVARPAAKETKVEGSITVPILTTGTLLGVFGIAKPVPYDFTEQEIEDLLSIGAIMGRFIERHKD